MAPKLSKGSKALALVVVLIVSALAAAGIAGLSREGSSAGLVSPERDCDSMNHFDSPQALAAYLAPPPAPQSSWSFFDFWGGGMLSGPGSATTGGTQTGTANTYSRTNNQVAGVDEADITKTDGQRIYTVSNGDVVILAAYPPESATVLSRIDSTATVIGLFVDGDRLVVLEGGTSGYDGHGRYVGWYSYAPPPTTIRVYDVSDAVSPSLVRSVTVSGSYLGARMIDGYVYVVAWDYAYASGDGAVLPTITTPAGTQTLTYSDVAYFEDSEGGSIATVTALRILGDEEPAYDAFVTRSASQIYVSAGNVYIAGSEYIGGDFWTASSEKSTIHKVSIDAGQVRYECSIRVPGTILNQFSMDEYNGYLRVATTTGFVSAGGGTSSNNVYVADAKLNPVGRLEGLAPGEQIHSARFMGERAYLVTFKKIDPLFVIDLSDPSAPRVLGYLKVPGYSDYLHPYDATHVIGVGKDAYDMGGFAWYQGVKVSLFDVTDVEHPTEVATYNIGDRGTDSEVLRDHKAFLFIPERNLVVLPIHLAEVDESQYPGGVPPEAYGQYVWQGAYALSVSLDGIELKGRITHGQDPGEYGYYPIGPHEIRRSLYIEDVLYTVSSATVRMNSLDTLEDLGGVTL